MANYDVTIIDGQGSETMKRGTYNVTVTAAGYDNTTLSPTTYTVTDEERTGTFTVSANGTLTFVVNETGAAGGTPVTGGTMIMTNADGTETYGEEVTITPAGTAVFANVPYGEAGTPYALYFRQLTSDDTHNIFDGVITVSMVGQTQTEYLLNTPMATQNFTLTDENYDGLPVASATLGFSE